MCKYAVIQWHWTPSQFINLPLYEKAFVIAIIEDELRKQKRK